MRALFPQHVPESCRSEYDIAFLVAPQLEQLILFLRKMCIFILKYVRMWGFVHVSVIPTGPEKGVGTKVIVSCGLSDVAAGN